MITPNKELEQRRIEARAVASNLHADKNQANIDYLSMMSGIDIPTEEEQPNE